MAEQMISKDQIIGHKAGTRDQCRVIDYDFKRPDKFSIAQIRTLAILHEGFARLTEKGLSGLLRQPVKVHVKNVDQMCFKEFTSSLPNICPIAVVNFKPIKSSMLIEIDPPVISALVNCLYGGQGESETLKGEPTAIQRIVYEKILREMMLWLGEAWSSLLPAQPEWGGLEIIPDFAQIVPPDEMVVTIKLPLTVGETEGFINLCFPFLTIEPVIEKLNPQYWYSRQGQNTKPGSNKVALDLLSTNSELLYRAIPLSLLDLGDLEEGSLVALHDPLEHPPVLRMGGEELLHFHRKPGKRLIFEPIGETAVESFFSKSKDEDKENSQIKENLKNLSQQLLSTSQDLAEKIEKLELRQDNRENGELLNSERLMAPALDPFGFITSGEIPALFKILSEDFSQITAFVLSRLEPALGSSLLELFPQEKQSQLISRIAKIYCVNKDITQLTADILKVIFTPMEKQSLNDPEGALRAAKILQNSPRRVERYVVESLELSDSELAEEIKSRIFIFEDIVLLEDNFIRLIYERAEPKDLLLAMKVVVEEEVLDCIYKQLTDSEKRDLQQKLKNLGRVKISDADRAQQKIVGLIKEIESNGEFEIHRNDELLSD